MRLCTAAFCAIALTGCASSNLPYSIAIGNPAPNVPIPGREQCVLRLDDITQEIAKQYRSSAQTVRSLQREFEIRLHERVTSEHDGLINCTDKNGNQVARSAYTPIEDVSKKWLVTYAPDSTDPDQSVERFREYLQSAQLVQDLSKQRLLPDQNDEDTYRGGSGNSDSMISGSLASPRPPKGGIRKERGDETDETESRSNL